VAAGYAGEIQHTVDMVILGDLMTLATAERAPNQVRAIAELKLDHLKNWLSSQRTVIMDESHRAFVFYALGQIKRFQDDPKKMNLTRPQDPPDGQPIGSFACDW
jgi:hypothetical protein